MLTIEECRQYLGEETKEMTDDEVTRVRDELYMLATIAVEHALSQKLK